jgi:site-specific recombinase XerC
MQADGQSASQSDAVAGRSRFQSAAAAGMAVADYQHGDVAGGADRLADWAIHAAHSMMDPDNDLDHTFASSLASIATSLAAIAEVLARTNGPRTAPPTVVDRAHIAGQYVRRAGDSYENPR